jgi:aerobic C4-dicarboxylate transport protein
LVPFRRLIVLPWRRTLLRNSFSSSPEPRRKPIRTASTPRRPRIGLSVQVFLAIALGVVVGALWPHFGAALKPLGDAFIKLIRMLLAPVIFGTVVLGIARMGDIKAVGRVGLKALVYFEVVSTLALALGLIYVNVFHPGSGMNVDPKTLSTSAISAYTSASKVTGPVEFFMDIIPSSPVDAFAKNSMLQIILFGILFGIALTKMGKRAQPLIDLMDQVLHAFYGIVGMVMKVAPIGAFGAIAFTVGKYGLASLIPLGWLVAGVFILCAFFGFVVLGVILRCAGFNIWKFTQYFKEELLVTFGTSSSEAVLPNVIAKLENLGIEKTTVGLVVPAGYTFNADGTALYLTMGAMFIAQALNVPLTLWQQVEILGVMMLVSKGSAGVAGAAFVTLAATLASIGTVPVAGMVLLLGVDRFGNAARAPLNVLGNAVATIVVARWENALDVVRAHRVLNGEKVEELEDEALVEGRTLAAGTTA